MIRHLRIRSVRCGGIVGLIGSIALTSPTVAEACAVCFGGVDSPMTAGMNNGILSLLGVIGAVQIGFVALFWRLRQRSRQLDKARENFRLIDGGAS